MCVGPLFGPVRDLKESCHVTHKHAVSIVVLPSFSLEINDFTRDFKPLEISVLVQLEQLMASSAVIRTGTKSKFEQLEIT